MEESNPMYNVYWDGEKIIKRIHQDPTGCRPLANSTFHQYIDFIVVFLIICISGNPSFISGPQQEPILLATSFLLAILLIRRKIKFIKRQFLIVLFIFSSIVLWQGVSFDYYSKSSIGFLLNIFIAFASVNAVSRFPFLYIKVLYFTTITGLIIYIFDNLLLINGVNVRNALESLIVAGSVTPRYSIFIYTFQDGEHLHRNSCLFWEPGVYSGYLLLGLIIISLIREEIEPSILKRYFAVFIISLFSTMSTTGYLVMPFTLLLFLKRVNTNRRNYIRRFLWTYLSLLIIFSVSYVLVDLPFVKEKTFALLNRAINKSTGWESSRFGAAIFDWEYIQKRPFSGWGNSNRTQFMLHPMMLVENLRLGNGLTGFTRQFGLVGLGTFIFFSCKAIQSKTKNMILSFYIVLLLLLLLIGEYYMRFSLYTSIMFWHWPVLQNDRIEPVTNAGHIKEQHYAGNIHA